MQSMSRYSGICLLEVNYGWGQLGEAPGRLIRWNHPKATHRMKGQLAKFRVDGVDVNETGKSDPLPGLVLAGFCCRQFSGFRPLPYGFRGHARFRRMRRWIILFFDQRCSFLQ